MNLAELATQIEMHLLCRRGFVSVREICERFQINERILRAKGDEPALLDNFAVSSSQHGESGYCHHAHLPAATWLKIASRMVRHAIGELRRVARWRSARRRILTGKFPAQYERHTGQQTLFPLS